MTLVDALLALTILAFVTLSLNYVTTAGHQHLLQGETSLRAARLAEHLLEEIVSRPYAGSGGPNRAAYHVDDYDAFAEEPGELTDFAGERYGEADQIFQRSAAVTGVAKTVAAFEGTEIEGKRITVTIEHPPTGMRWTLTRFLPEPLEP